MADQNREYIKKTIIRLFEGKVSETELGKIKKVLTDYDREEWKKIIVIFKELYKEKVDEIISSLKGILIPNEWESDVKNLAHLAINFAFTIGNENLFYGIMKLENQTNLTDEEKITKTFLLLIPEIKKVVAKSAGKKVADYHKVEVSLTKKINEYFAIKAKGEKEKPGSQKELDLVLKVVKIIKSLSTDEIIVLKKKSKGFVVQAMKSLSILNPELSQKLSKIPQIIKPFLDLADVLIDEKLAKDALNLLGGYLEKRVKEGKPAFDDSFIIEMFSNQELPGLIVSLTNNLNKLAKEGVEDNNISQEVLDTIATDISQSVGNRNDYPRPQPGNSPYNFMTELGKALAKIDPSQFRNYLTTVQSKGKWYQDPANIGLLGVGGALLSGLLVWLFLKRRKQSKYENTKK